MKRYLAAAVVVLSACAGNQAPSPPPSPAPMRVADAIPQRAVRRDIPLTNMIRRAFAAGTRDSTGRPGAKYWQLGVDYTINAKLDPKTATVSGRETVVVKNTSPTPLLAITLRLDQNIFSPTAARLESPPEVTEGMKITKLVVNGQAVDLNYRPQGFRQGQQPPPAPTGPIAMGLDQTVARVTLPQPLQPGESATLDAEWYFRVTRVEQGRRGMRHGRWADTLFQVAQWYPRVTVYDDLRQGGWDTDPYLGPSEFYNNFGRFDVSIDVPAGWIVGATGVLQNPQQVLTPAARERLTHVLESDARTMIVPADERGPGKATQAGDRLVWRFVADTVGDFAWATSANYVWEATRANIPERGPVPIYIYYPLGRAQAFTQVGERTRHALQFYSKLWMPYAFPQMSVADGPENGMEYPMFIMSGLGAADHEAGHEWWPMMVGNNETWYGFMDEGFNQYMNILSNADAAGRAPNLNGPGQMYGRTSGSEQEAPLMWDANYGGPSYSFQAYGKAPLMLSMLGGIVGDTAVWQAMSGYAKAWKFKHPTPWDYAFYMSNALHQDLGWFWYYWLFTTEAVHGSIQNASIQGGSGIVTVRQDGEMPSPVVLKVEFAATGAPITPMANAKMIDEKTAIVTFPVDVWFSGSRTYDAVLRFGERPIEKITLDPFGRFPDRDPSDNVWPRK